MILDLRLVASMGWQEAYLHITFFLHSEMNIPELGYEVVHLK